MTAYTDVHARPRLGSRDGASGCATPVTDAVATGATVSVAVIAAVRVSDSGDVDTGVGKCHGTTATTLTTSVTAAGTGFEEVTRAGFTPRDRSKARGTIVFSVEPAIHWSSLRGQYCIHGRTSENIEQTTFWALRRDFVIHGKTSSNRKPVFAASELMHVPNGDYGCSDDGRWRANTTTTAALTTTGALTAVGSGQVASIDCAPCRTTPYRWRSTIANTVADVILDGMAQLDFISWRVAARHRRTIHVATVFAVILDTAGRDPESSRRRRATQVGGR